MRETISYIPIDPAPASPYGRPPAAPAIFASLFLLGLLHDLRRVVAQQGYPRYDLAIVIEQLKKATPPSIMQDPVQWKAWVDATVGEVQAAYNALEPDSAFVHTDVVTVNRPTGAVSAEALGGIDPLIKALERQLARALKTMPLLMGMIEGQSEANANRQWELQAAGIKAVQHLSEADLSEKANLICEANGQPAECEWRFSELRAAERYRDAMSSGMEIDNATKLWMMGVIGQKELAHVTTGEPSDQPHPRFITSANLSYEAAMTTNSARADGEPAIGKKKPNEAAADAVDNGDSKDPQARSNGLHWPKLPSLRASQSTNALQPGGDPLPYVPTDVGYDAGDRRRLSRTWDDTVPDARGLLDALVDDGSGSSTGDDVRLASESLREVAHELRDLIATMRSQPATEPANRTVTKVVERDERGMITGVVEHTA